MRGERAPGAERVLLSFFRSSRLPSLVFLSFRRRWHTPHSQLCSSISLSCKSEYLLQGDFFHSFKSPPLIWQSCFRAPSFGCCIRRGEGVGKAESVFLFALLRRHLDPKVRLHSRFCFVLWVSSPMLMGSSCGFALGFMFSWRERRRMWRVGVLVCTLLHQSYLSFAGFCIGIVLA